MGAKEDLDELETKIEELRIAYERYFMGLVKREPFHVKSQVIRLVNRHNPKSLGSSSLAFRYSTLLARYTSLQHYWHRIMQQIEAGTYARHRFQFDLEQREQRQASAVGAPGAEPATSPAPPTRSPELDEARVRAIFEEFIRARQVCREPVEHLSVEVFREALLKQAQKVKETYRVGEVDFKIVIEQGKTKIKVVVRT